LERNDVKGCSLSHSQLSSCSTGCAKEDEEDVTVKETQLWWRGGPKNLDGYGRWTRNRYGLCAAASPHHQRASLHIRGMDDSFLSRTTDGQVDVTHQKISFCELIHRIYSCSYPLSLIEGRSESCVMKGTDDRIRFPRFEKNKIKKMCCTKTRENRCLL